MSLSAERNTLKVGALPLATYQTVPVKASTTIYKGALVALSAGYAVGASAAPGLVILGRAEETVDNSTGSNGDKTIKVAHGVFIWDVYASDAVTQADAGKDVFAYDDHTIAKTDGNSGARSKVGKFLGFADDGTSAMVETLPATANLAQERIESIPVDLASIAAGAFIGPFVMPYSGRITKVEYLGAKAASTASKLATVTPRITPLGGSATALTGGAVALTTANSALGAPVAGSAVTANNTFKAGDSIDLFGSSVTAFVEGSGSIRMHIQPL